MTITPSSAPQLTFVVAAHDAERTLQRTLGSLVTDVDPQAIELLIIDDGSTDATAHMAEAFCSVNRNARLLRQANRGLGAVRNRGIDEARGDYVTFCDADDIFLPTNHLRLLAQMRAEHADVGVGTGFAMTDNDTIDDWWDNAIVRQMLSPAHANDRDSLKFLLQPSACTKIFRRDYLNEHALRFTAGRLFEDVEFTTGSLLLTSRVSAMNRPLFIYDVRRTGSLTTDASQRRFEIFQNLAPIIELANRTALSGPQALCLLTSLLRTVLWCMDNVPVDMIDAFNLQLLQTIVHFRLCVNADDKRAAEPLMRDEWDQRAFRIVDAIWLSQHDAPALMKLMAAARK